MSQETAALVRDAYQSITHRLSRRIVGMEDVTRLLITSVFADGHALLVGVPGLAKTLLVSSMAELLDLSFSRIQFTPDLMPSDITGAEVIVEDKTTGERRFEFLKGPLFSHVILADEINRTPPKTQAALMEAMEEHQVSSLGRRFELEEPFFVLATQNPIEQEGTYPLPAAQLDRFLFEINVDYPAEKEEEQIVRQTTRPHDDTLEPVLAKDAVLEIIGAVRSLPVPEDIARYATTLARRSRPDEDGAPEVVTKYVSFGAGPRAAQALVTGAKVLAMMRGETRPTHADVRTLTGPVLRHRIVLNFLAAADGVPVEEIIQGITASVQAPDFHPEPATTKRKKGLFSFFAKNAK